MAELAAEAQRPQVLLDDRRQAGRRRRSDKLKERLAQRLGACVAPHRQ